MSTVTLSTATIQKCRDLFTLYSRKGSFQLEEYEDAGAVYKRLSEAVKQETEADVSVIDARYVVSAIGVCAQRSPVEVQNYKPISDLLHELTEALKTTSDDEETKAEF